MSSYSPFFFFPFSPSARLYDFFPRDNESISIPNTQTISVVPSSDSTHNDGTGWSMDESDEMARNCPTSSFASLSKAMPGHIGLSDRGQVAPTPHSSLNSVDSLEVVLPDPARDLLAPLAPGEINYHSVVCSYDGAPGVLVITNLGIHLSVPIEAHHRPAFHIFLNYLSLDPNLPVTLLEKSGHTSLAILSASIPLAISLNRLPKASLTKLLEEIHTFTTRAWSCADVDTLNSTVPGWQLKAGSWPVRPSFPSSIIDDLIYV